MSEHEHNHIYIDSEGKEHMHSHTHGGIHDYTQAVNEYRKTFPNKQDVLEQTPDPAVKEMLLRMEQLGMDTAFDRFDAQKPQCTFGLAGVCCKICNMGPCRITPKRPRGVCGADADLIVARNLLRSVAAGVAQHGMHAREVMLSLKYAAEGRLNVPIENRQKVLDTAVQFGIETENREFNEIAMELADVLLEDLSRTVSDEYKTITAFAPEERQKVWKDLDVLPISAYHEVFESLHRTGCATDGDWRNIMQQFLRCGLAFVFSGVVGTSIATDSLFGVGHRMTSKVNIGALKKGYVNIAVHGHNPLLVSRIVHTGQSENYTNLAKEKGAKGIQFYGICCSGLSAMYRYDGVIPLCNAVGAEMVLGTGALDLWVADVQEVFPSIMDVAECFKTVVVTTSDSARLPRAEHYGFDHHYSNIEDVDNLAEKIVNRAIEAFEDRQGIPAYIPSYEITAEVGFSVEYIHERFGGMEPLAKALESGDVFGILNLAGCNNPKVIFEKAIIDIADIMLQNNVLILTNGCASFPLLKLGCCQNEAVKRCGKGLQHFLGNDLPPVWHMGECIDNTRASGVFGGVAGTLGKRMMDLPYAMSSPEWGNEKGIGAALAFRMNGISSYHCVEAQVYGSEKVMKFLKEETQEMIGATMNVNTDPKALAQRILDDMRKKRDALGWKSLFLQMNPSLGELHDGF